MRYFLIVLVNLISCSALAMNLTCIENHPPDSELGRISVELRQSSSGDYAMKRIEIEAKYPNNLRYTYLSSKVYCSLRVSKTSAVNGDCEWSGNLLFHFEEGNTPGTTAILQKDKHGQIEAVGKTFVCQAI